MTTPTFPALCQRFFTDRLSAQMEASPNTIAGYRDTFRLLLRFAAQQRGKTPTNLRVEDVDAELDPATLEIHLLRDCRRRLRPVDRRRDRQVGERDVQPLQVVQELCLEGLD